ncbi:MAG: NAD(P)H-dependent oxidoreductase [Spirochaetes bacterium]|nr:NAD(P)H-dependent oxidoreductase [Spirochaetota bacterium]
MYDFVLIKPLCREKSKMERLDYVLERSLKNYKYNTIATSDEFERADLKGKKVVFAFSLGESGINLEYYEILKKIRLDKNSMEGCTGALIVDGASEFYTKAIARELTLSANMAGCTFIGKSLVEGTGTLKNYNIIAKNLSADNLEAYIITAEALIKNLTDFKSPVKSTPRILVVHAGSSKKSNTKMLWDIVRENLGNVTIEEIALQDGEIKDCKGCPYVTCRHFGEQSSCFYGGVITEQVYPAILTCDALIVVSPNYNDAPTAYISAFINRLTALLRVNQLSGKQLFAIIVSGYSGGDLVAEQLIGALNMNKPFILPSRFALFETANNPGEIKEIPEIEKSASAFAENILKQIKT